MKLSDVVSAMHLTIFAEVPLLVFLGVFIGVAIHVFQRNGQFEAMRRLPLERDESDEGQNQ